MFVMMEPECKVQIAKWQGSSLVYGIDVRKIIRPGDTLVSSNAALFPDTGLQTLTEFTNNFQGTVIMARVSPGNGSVDVWVDVAFSWQTLSGDLDRRMIRLALVDQLPQCNC